MQPGPAACRRSYHGRFEGPGSGGSMLAHIRPSSLLALAVLGFAASAQAKVVSSSETGFIIENSVVVPTDPNASWRALVENVGQWWPSDHTWFGSSQNLRIEPRAGGCFCEI